MASKQLSIYIMLISICKICLVIPAPPHFPDDTAFVWDEGRQQSVFAGPDGKYRASSARRVCADRYLTASDAYHTSARHFQAAGSSRGLPPSTGVRRMIHCTPLP